jgi:hypothetical protein
MIWVGQKNGGGGGTSVYVCKVLYWSALRNYASIGSGVIEAIELSWVVLNGVWVLRLWKFPT